MRPHYDDLALKNNPSPATVRKSLRASLWDGIAWSLTVGFAEMFFAPFALYLGATDVRIGLLATVPQVVGDFCQLATPRLAKAMGSRKRLVLLGIVGQAAFLICLATLIFWPARRLEGLMTFSIFYWACWMVITPAWQSWMGDLVPSQERGRYFGLRNRWIQIVTFGALIAGGSLLQSFQEGNTAIGFFWLMVLGAAGRLLSLVFVRIQTDLPETFSKTSLFSFRDFLGDLRRTNFGRFVLFVSVFAAAVNISGSYFVPFVLEEVGLGYAHFMALLALMFGTKFLTLPVWGHLSDRYGSRRLFVLACALFCLPPLLLLVSRNFYYLAAVQLLGGFAIGGFELCSFNFLLDNTEPAHRTRAAAYYQVLTGLGIVSGAVVGGLLLKYSAAAINPFLSVFLTSGVLRLILAFILLPGVREVRQVPHVSYRQLLGQLVRFQKSVAE